MERRPRLDDGEQPDRRLHHERREPRRASLFPFVDIRTTDATAYTSIGTDPFTPNNELRYNTFQIQNNLTRFSARHSWTFGGTLQRYESENVFFSLSPGAWVYNSLQDFYTDANGYLANPNRTTSPVTAARYQLRYSNIPDLDKPLQPLGVWYGGAYVQDEFRPAANLTITAGLRFDVPMFENTAFDNPQVDALTFRDETGSAVQYTRARCLMRTSCGRHGWASTGMWPATSARRYAAEPASSPAPRFTSGSRTRSATLGC